MANDIGPSYKSGKQKTNKHKHFRRDGLRDKQEPSLGQMGPLPGTKWDPSLGQTGLSLFNSTVKSLFCPVCPWDGWGFVPGTIVPQGPSEKCLCVFCLLVFLLPNKKRSETVPPHQRPPHQKNPKIKPVSRIFEISNSNAIQGKGGKCGRPLSGMRNKGLRRSHRAKTWKTRGT